jgi:hypothetical protein
MIRFLRAAAAAFALSLVAYAAPASADDINCSNPGSRVEAGLCNLDKPIVAVSCTVTRPADGNAYAIGDLIANSTTAGSVTPCTLAVSRTNDGSFFIRRMRLKTNDTAFAGAVVRVHLFKNSPTMSVGDNGVFSGGMTESNNLGYCEVTLDRHFSDAEKGFCTPNIGSEFAGTPDTGTKNVYALLEDRTVQTPGSAKVFTLVAEVWQN